MIDLESTIASMPEKRHEIMDALKVLVDTKLLSKAVQWSANQLIDKRMDWEDSDAILKEIREQRQTNRILLGFEESAREITKGMTNE